MRCLYPHYARRERAQLPGEICFEEALVRPRGDMPYEHSRGEFKGGRKIRRGCASKDLDGGAGGGDALRGLDDVDIHSAGVASAGLVQRRGVDRKNGDSRG